MPLKISGLPVTSLKESSTSLHCLRTLQEEIKTDWRDKLSNSSDTYLYHTVRRIAQQDPKYYPKVLLWALPFWLWIEGDDLCGMEEFILSSETNPAPPSQRAPLNNRGFSVPKVVRLRNSTLHTKTFSPKIRAQEGLRCQKPSPWNQGVILEQSSLPVHAQTKSSALENSTAARAHPLCKRRRWLHWNPHCWPCLTRLT